MREPGRESKGLAGAAPREIGLEAIMVKQAESRRAEMSQVLTPEEMAALLEGLREAEDAPGSLYYHAPKETTSRGRVFPERDRISSYQNLSTWLMVLADLRWPHL